MQQDAKNILIEYIKNNEAKLYRIAYSYVAQRDAALDIVQEAIIKALENIDKLRVKEYVKTWFYRILINEAIKESKSNKSFIEFELAENEICHNSQENELVENLDIYENIQKLNKKLKTVILLRFFENLKIEEIAYITRTNTSTVKSRLYKGIGEIRKNMERRSL